MRNNTKARIKATGEIGIVANIDILFGCKGYRYQSDEVEIIDSYAEVDTDADPDYWTRLEHTYVGMFMKSFLDNFDGTTSMEILADDAIKLAHALVEKMKEERK